MFRLNSIVVLLIAACLLAGCGPSEPAFQYANLRYVQMMRTAVSSQDAEKVDKVMEAVRLKREADELRPEEEQALRRIADLTKDGRWNDAEQACFALEEAQQFRRR
jgi:uncharacterized lipoprotein YmbA